MEKLIKAPDSELVIEKQAVVEKHDVFGDEDKHDIQYKTMTWQVCLFFLDVSGQGTRLINVSLSAA